MRTYGNIFPILPVKTIYAMFHDGQLTPKEISAVQSWVNSLGEHLNKFPMLSASVDLVIEAGIGNGITLPHIVRRLFPNALYVGTDISPQLMFRLRKRRIRNQIDNESIQEIIRANAGTAKLLEAAVIYANCFDGNLVNDIMRKTERSVPLLVSFNAIGSLTDRKINMDERKEQRDNISVDHWFYPDLPYIGQMHVINYILDWQTPHPPTIFDSSMREVLTHAQLNHYAVEQMDMGLLVVKS